MRSTPSREGTPNSADTTAGLAALPTHRNSSTPFSSRNTPSDDNLHRHHHRHRHHQPWSSSAPSRQYYHRYDRRSLAYIQSTPVVSIPLPRKIRQQKTGEEGHGGGQGSVCRRGCMTPFTIYTAPITRRFRRCRRTVLKNFGRCSRSCQRQGHFILHRFKVVISVSRF